ncbi:MAG: D-cysteine desulfhydrase family protein [Armatimonadota bacterium]
MRLFDFPRVDLADLPTAVDEAPRLAKEIGLDRLLIKRDDNTGLAMGGNKARKLEYLMAQAKSIGADVVLACGGVQSNHVRMTAAAAKKLGMECVIFVPDPMPDSFEGNLLLDIILGAKVIFLPGITWTELDEAMDAEKDRLSRDGRVPYVIPVGGSTALGSFGYVNAVHELNEQLAGIGACNADIVVALGSGGTLAGIVLGTYLFMPDSTPVGISVVLEESIMRAKVVRIANEAARLVGIGHEPDLGRMRIFDQYVGEGYGIPTPEAKEAILLTARTEGIILDPVYTGKAMAGLIDLARKGEIGRDRPVLFWHTGGAPALFANSSLFRDEASRLSM